MKSKTTRTDIKKCLDLAFHEWWEDLLDAVGEENELVFDWKRNTLIVAFAHREDWHEPGIIKALPLDALVDKYLDQFRTRSAEDINLRDALARNLERQADRIRNFKPKANS